MNRTVDITQWFAEPSLTKYGDMDVLFKARPESVKAESLPDGTVKIQGFASTPDVDLAQDVIQPEAFRSSLAEYMKRGTTLFMHDWYGIPIGKMTKAEIKEGGLWVEGAVLPTSDGKDVAMMIEAGVLDAFSVGFGIKKSENDEETGIRTITDLHLHEISVVNAGMNPAALFTQAKALGLTVPSTHSVATEKHTKEPNMATPTLDQEHLDLLKKCSDLLVQHGPAIETVSTEMAGLKTNIGEQVAMIKALEEKHTQFAQGIIKKDDLDAFIQKIGREIAEVQEAIKAGHAGNKALQAPAAALMYTDWRLIPEAKDMVFDTDDNGRPLSPMEQKAFRYFQVPVTYDDTEWSHWLKSLRDVNDVCTIVGAYVRGTKPHVNLMQLKSFQLLHAMMEKTDPEFAKAMYATGTGVGDEWVPTLMSANLFDLYRLTPSIESLIPGFEMPSNPYDWPVKSSGATLYRAAEAASNNPDQLTKSEFGTTNTLFNAETFAVAIPVSPQLIEDAIIPMVGEITKELAFISRDGYESMLVNGDNTATHRDTGKSYASINPETYEDGLRFLATDLGSNVNLESSTAGIGDGASTFTATDCRYLRKTMGKRGKNPKDCAFVTNMDLWFKILGMSEFSQPGTYNAGQTWRDGTLTLMDGSELVITEHMENALNAAGVYTAATGAHSGIICFNKTAFKIGSKRGMTVEFEKNILTQQWAFVGSMRKSFQNMDPSSLTPVAYGYNITS